MAHRPVSVVRQRVDFLQRHHRAFKGRHAVKRQRHNHEAHDRVGAHFVPGTGQGHDAVDHAAPRRHQQQDGERGSQRGCPVRQRSPVQMVRAHPHVHEAQCPEVDNRQAIGIDRATGLLGHKVIHHAEEGRGQEETHCVMAIPPLRHRILYAREQTVGFHREQVDGHRQIIKGVQQGGRQNEGQIEPVGHIDVWLLAAHDGADEQYQIGDPHHLDQDIDRPFHFRVLARLGITQHIADISQHDDCHPAPKGEAGHAIRNQACLAGALDHIVGRSKQRRAAEAENHRGGVDRPEPAE